MQLLTQGRPCITGVALIELLGIWAELVEAKEGVNGFGGNVAEIYEYRLQRRNPLDEDLVSKGEPVPPSDEAAEALQEILCLFAKEYRTAIWCDGQLAATWRGLSATPIKANGRRYHIMIGEGAKAHPDAKPLSACVGRPSVPDAADQWFVSVDAPGTEWGGWSFHTKDEHSARLAVDAINYASSGEPPNYTLEKLR